MSRKLVALVLLLAMICPMLFACGSELIDDAKDYLDKNKVDNTRTNVTINFFMMSEIEIAEADRLAMQIAFNNIIETKYNTHVEFTFVEKSVYAEKLAEKFASVDSAKADKNNSEMTKQEYDEAYPGIESSNEAYPDIAPTQMDIFLSIDSESYISYIENGDIVDLTSMINANWRDFSDAKKETQAPNNGVTYNPTVSDIIFSNAYYFKQVYADATEAAAQDVEELKLYYGLPSTFVVGSYNYQFVRKAEADQYYVSLPAEATDKETAKKLTADLEKLKNKLLNAGCTEEDYADVVLSLNNVPYGTTPDIEGFNIDDYYTIILKKPQATYEEICKYMFCVSTDTVNSARCYEVLHELYTNAELHTILQYGSPVSHYTFDDVTETVTLKPGAENLYKMDMRYTGNMFTIYPCETNDVVGSYNDLKIANIQNLDATLPVIPANKYYSLQLSVYEAFKKMYNSMTGEALPGGVYTYYELNNAPYAELLKAAAGVEGIIEVFIVKHLADDAYGYVMQVKTELPSTDPTMPTKYSYSTFEFWAKAFNKNGEHKAELTFKYDSTSIKLTNEYTYNLPYATFVSTFNFIGTLENEDQNEQDVNCTATVNVAASSFASTTIENEGLTLADASKDLSDVMIRTVFVAEYVEKLDQALQLYNIFARSIGAPTASDLGFTSYN